MTFYKVVQKGGDLVNTFEETIVRSMIEKYRFEPADSVDFDVFRIIYGKEYIKIIDKLLSALIKELIEDEDIIKASLIRLSKSERLSIFLSSWFNMNAVEISRILGVAEATVRTYKSRGIKKIRKYLKWKKKLN